MEAGSAGGVIGVMVVGRPEDSEEVSVGVVIGCAVGEVSEYHVRRCWNSRRLTLATLSLGRLPVSTRINYNTLNTLTQEIPSCYYVLGT